MEKKVKAAHLLVETDPQKLVNQVEDFTKEKLNHTITYSTSILPSTNGAIPMMSAFITWDCSEEELRQFRAYTLGIIAG